MTEDEWAALSDAARAEAVNDFKRLAAKRTPEERAERKRRRWRSVTQMRLNDGPSARPTLGENGKALPRFRTKRRRD